MERERERETLFTSLEDESDSDFGCLSKKSLVFYESLMHKMQIVNF